MAKLGRMINIALLSASDVGRWVLYVNGTGQCQKGRIKSWAHDVIYVVYQCGEEWNRYREFVAAATDPTDLEFEPEDGEPVPT
jgi:hypothetical protein